MNKIYTSILCIALLAPISAQAEICTDFDENFNIIEFDCAEGVVAARKRIAAEQAKAKSEAQQKAEQERIEREKLAEQEQLRKAAERAEREKQQELERAEREKQKAAERAEREKQKAAERAEREKQKAAKRAEREARFQQKQQEITQGGCWKFVVGLGGDFWSGTDLSSGVYVGETLDGGYTVLDAGYSVGGATLNAELGARYYLKNSLRHRESACVRSFPGQYR